MNLLFWSNNAAPQKMISKGRIQTRSKKVNSWAKEAEKHEKAIAEIDEQLSKLSGRFTRAKREMLQAAKLQHIGLLNIALSHLGKEKYLLERNIKHNQTLAKKRLF